MADFPFDDIAKRAKEIVEEGHFTLFQKFTCEKCGQRLTMDVPNTFYVEGGCDKCGHITNIKKNGCNYVMITAQFADIMRKLGEQN